MKFALLSLSLLLSTTLAHAGDVLNCDVVTAQDEDIIRIAEYPTVSITDTEANLGGASYPVAEGATIVEHFNGTRRAVRVFAKGDGDRFEILMDTVTGKATLSFQENSQAVSEEFATLICR